MMDKIFLTLLEISIGVGIIVALLILVAPRIDKRYNSRWKYYLWIFLTIRLLIPLNPIIFNTKNILNSDLLQNSIFLSKFKSSIQLNDDISNMEIKEISTSKPLDNLRDIEKKEQHSSFNVQGVKFPETSMLKLVIATWILGILIHSLYTITGYIIYRKRILRWSSPILEENSSDMIKEISKDMGINRDIILMEYRGDISPQIMGFLKNIMILPNNKLREDELRFIVVHELTHLKKHHLWLKLLSALMKSIHWFNPFVYYIVSELETEMEIQCDCEVTKILNNEERKNYADTIIKLIDIQFARCNNLTTCFEGGKKRMKKRITTIMEKRNKKKGIIPFILVSLVTILICGTIAFAKENTRILNENQTMIAHNNIRINKGEEVVEDPHIEKEREKIAKQYIKSKEVNNRFVLVFTGEVTDVNEELFELVNIKGTENPKDMITKEYLTSWDDIGNMIYSDYIFPKGKFIAEADGPFNICIYHDDGSADIISATKSENKYEVDVEVGDSYYVSLHNRKEKYRALSDTKYLSIPEE